MEKRNKLIEGRRSSDMNITPEQFENFRKELQDLNTNVSNYMVKADIIIEESRQDRQRIWNKISDHSKIIHGNGTIGLNEKVRKLEDSHKLQSKVFWIIASALVIMALTDISTLYKKTIEHLLKDQPRNEVIQNEKQF